jgi:hypothetical protein
MKNALILLAGGLMGYGVFLVMKKRGCNGMPVIQKTRMAAPGPAAAPAVTLTETTEYLPAYAAMIGHFDARPEATFAPPKAYVAVQGVNDMITNPYFGGKIVV